jgi:hypothetical protein
MGTGQDLSTFNQFGFDAMRRHSKASSSASKSTRKWSPGLAGTAAGTVNRRFESSVTIMVGYSHYRPTVSTWAGEQKALAHFGFRNRSADFGSGLISRKVAKHVLKHEVEGAPSKALSFRTKREIFLRSLGERADFGLRSVGVLAFVVVVMHRADGASEEECLDRHQHEERLEAYLRV